MYDIINKNWILSPVMEKCQAEKKAGRELQEHKHNDWDENYTLYRNKVRTNRLTQRQAVNIPLMKETVKSLLAKMDEMPEVDWKELSGDEQKELIYQEIWNDQVKKNHLEVIDVIDKKNVLLYGLSVKKLNISDKGIDINVLDIYDIIFDPLMNFWDIESGRFIIHQNIFRTVREILADGRYTKQGKDELKIWADSEPGITQSNENKEAWEDKMERIKSMGVEHSDFPYFAGGDRIVNLTEHYTKIWNAKKEKFEKRVIVYADEKIELLNETLEDLIGVDFYPFTLWGEDPETNDVYPDSVADLVRTPNKVLNVWFSQLIENRTLKNFQMHWFLPSQGYTPQTYTPGPGVMLPAPPGDDISKVIKPVEISGLDDTLTAIQAVVQIAERGSGATAIEKGISEKGQQTLGEIQILVGKTTERVVAMAKFYRLAMYDLAKKWNELLNVNALKFVKLFKVSKSGKAYLKTILQKDWKSDEGYEPIISSSSEQEQENTKSIQKFMFILSQFPNNPVLRTIAQKRMLEIVDLTPEELKQVEEAEKQLQIQQPQMQPQQQLTQMPQMQKQMQPQMQI
uniref:Portal protein n=1 Tax=viral metagenome TaxID=1070528 RepID=A0A6H1ZRK5_9ZZZZ